jgi:alpha-1,2-mannosyltransferase
MRFIQSEFRGQLPKLYDGSHKSKGLETRIVYDDFNDLNKEETSRYMELERCHYLIDSSQNITTDREPDYSKNTNDWQVLSSHNMLDLCDRHVVTLFTETKNCFVDSSY